MYIRKLSNQVTLDYGKAEADTPKGRLRGVYSDGTYVFRGIRYAIAKRFHPPVPVEPWTGVKEAIVYGYACPEVRTVMPHDNYTVPHYFSPQHEDCQYLNIWTKGLNPDGKRPVMVWLHGGGFSTGSGVEHFAYDGENMANREDVVVVTINHRLNVLGFLDLSAYGEEYSLSGNVGMADIVASLQWIRENISSFGGDPENVTIFGQSGGGGKVAALLQMPAAEGLFHKAVIQSGIINTRSESSREEEREKASMLLEQLGIDAKHIHELEALPYDALAAAVMKLGSNMDMHWAPVADGKYYSGSIFVKGSLEFAKKIPVIVGSVLGEFTTNFNYTLDDDRKNEWQEEKRRRIVRTVLGNSADAAMSSFSKAYPDRNTADVLFVDYMFRSGALAYAKARAADGCADTYNYLFALDSPIYGGTLPWHNSEIPYVFHNADYLEASYEQGITEKLQNTICDAWGSFARTGSPQTSALKDWKPYTADAHNTVIFDRTVRYAVDHDKELLCCLSGIERKLVSKERGGGAIKIGGGPKA